MTNEWIYNTIKNKKQTFCFNNVWLFNDGKLQENPSWRREKMDKIQELGGTRDEFNL